MLTTSTNTLSTRMMCLKSLSCVQHLQYNFLPALTLINLFKFYTSSSLQVVKICLQIRVMVCLILQVT